MGRLVLLQHDPPASAPHLGRHFDLLFERRSADAQLLSFRLDRALDPAAAGTARAQPLPEHRALYLDYEGPISDDRGHVRRMWRSHAELAEETPDRVRLILDSGASLTVDREGDSWRAVLTPAAPAPSATAPTAADLRAPMTRAPAKFGPYVFTGELGAVRIAPDALFTRLAAVHELLHTSHLVYRLDSRRRDKFALRRFLRAVESAAGYSGPHALGIEAFALHPSGTACLVTPYPGDLVGLTTLAALLRAKGGRFPPAEAARAAQHLLQGLARAEEAGRVHGPFDLDTCLVDRAGRISIELFGLARAWNADRAQRSDENARREQLASVARIVAALLTGEPHAPNAADHSAAPDDSSQTHSSPDSPDAADPASADLDPEWSAYLSRLLDPAEPLTAAEALAALPRPNGPSPNAPTSLVRTIWDKVKHLARGA